MGPVPLPVINNNVGSPVKNSADTKVFVNPFFMDKKDKNKTSDQSSEDSDSDSSDGDNQPILPSDSSDDKGPTESGLPRETSMSPVLLPKDKSKITKKIKINKKKALTLDYFSSENIRARDLDDNENEIETEDLKAKQKQ